MLKVCLLCTEYQKKIFLSILEQTQQDKNDFIFILSGSIYEVSGAANVYRVQNKDRKFSFKEARALIHEMGFVLKSIIKNSEYSLWLASDGHPVGQALLNNHSCKNIHVFEDGLGSYVNYGFFDFDRKVINIIARVRNWIYLVPKFRATRFFGNYKNVDSSWAFNDKAFPWLSSKPQIIDKNKAASQFVPLDHFDFQIDLNLKKILFFLDQPVIEDKILSKDEHRNSILSALTELGHQSKNINKIFIKKHPRSDPHVFLETVTFLQKRLDIEVEICELDCSFETLLIFLEKKYSDVKLIVVSSFSTALYTTKILIPQTDVYCFFDHVLIRKQKQGHFFALYMKALESFGVKLVTINEA